MAIKALTKVVPDWYTPECEFDIEQDEEGKETARHAKPDATRFKIRPLTPPEKEAVSEFLPDGSGRLYIPPKNFGLVLRYGLSDWERFADEQGKPLKFSVTNFDRIRPDIRLELVSEILTRSDVTEEEAKN